MTLPRPGSPSSGDVPKDAALAYLDAVFPDGSEGILHWAVKVPGSEDWTENTGRWPAIRETVADAMLKESPRLDVYICPYLGSTRKRTKGKSVSRNVVHTDADNHDLDAETVRAIGGFAVASGTEGHAHVYVPLAQSVPLAEHTILCQRLCAVFHGDIAKHSDNDVLRPPGTLNHKPTLDGGNPVQVEWLVPFDGSRVDADALAKLLDVNDADPNLNGHARIDAEDIDLHLYPTVSAAINKVTGDRSGDTYGILAACYDAGFTRAHAFSTARRREDIRQRLDDEGHGEDLQRCWDKIVDDRQQRVRLGEIHRDTIDDPGDDAAAQHVPSKPGEGTWTDSGNAAKLAETFHGHAWYVPETAKWLRWSNVSFHKESDDGRAEYLARKLADATDIPEVPQELIDAVNAANKESEGENSAESPDKKPD
jgi:putative DNA primase/helicase